MSTQINIGLKNDAEAVDSLLNRKKNFFLVVHNFQGHYLPQVRVVLTGPPEVRLKIKSEWYGGIGNGNKKSRLFSIIPKADGIYTLTATLSSKKITILTIPVEIRVGNVQIPPKSFLQQVKSSQIIQKSISKLNCPFCGDSIENVVQYCPVCGSDLKGKLDQEKEIKKCPNCAREVLLDSKFCTGCGNKIDN